jgi:hypothetical protein
LVCVAGTETVFSIGAVFISTDLDSTLFSGTTIFESVEEDTVSLEVVDCGIIGCSEIFVGVSTFSFSTWGAVNPIPINEKIIAPEQIRAIVFLLGITLITFLKIDGRIGPTIKTVIERNNVNKNKYGIWLKIKKPAFQ